MPFSQRWDDFDAPQTKGFAALGSFKASQCNVWNPAQAEVEKEPGIGFYPARLPGFATPAGHRYRQTDRGATTRHNK